MIEHAPLPKGWNKHHTLYYRRWYQSREITAVLRESGSMVVPMPVPKHNELHRNVPPEEVLPSDILAGYALHVCDELERSETEFTPLEGFTIVRDELEALGKMKRRFSTRSLGKEALRFVDFFDCQLDYMSEVPILSR